MKSRSATKAGKSCGKLEKSEDGGVGSSQRRAVAILKQKAADVVDLQRFIIFSLHLNVIYESFSDVGESRVWFASKNLTPCRMH